MTQFVDSLWGHSKFKTVQTLRPLELADGADRNLASGYSRDLDSTVFHLSKALAKAATRIDWDAKVIIPYRQSGTLGTVVFLCGAILGQSGHQVVLHLSTAWGGLETETTSHTTCV